MTRAVDLKPYEGELNPDEKIMGLVEVDLLTSDYKELHRYEIIYAIRDDKTVPFVRDLGASLKHLGPPMRIPVLLEHTVAETREIAEQGRQSGVRQRLKELREQSAEGGLIDTWVERQEQTHKYKQQHRRTVPHG